jgi:hypothetical protein
MASPLPVPSSDQPILAGKAEAHHLHLQDVGGIGEHVWTDYVPFGGHFLLICRCGCPGPFVMALEDGRHVECGVAQSWRDGTARLAMCAERERRALVAV